MIEVFPAIGWVLEPFKDWITERIILAFKGDPLEGKAERAYLEAFYKALHETRKYLGTISKCPNEATRDEETRIADVWMDAAKLAREINPELARRADLKAQYWSDPNKNWNEAPEIDNLISIAQMEQLAKILLFPSNGT